MTTSAGYRYRFEGAMEGEMPTTAGPGIGVEYLPILDVSRGTAAGYQSQFSLRAFDDGGYDVSPPSPEPPGDGRDVDVPSCSPSVDAASDAGLVAQAIRIALGAARTLPRNTFLTLPVPARLAAAKPIRDVLGSQEGLRGIVLDITGFDSSTPVGDLEYVLAQHRDNGALIAVGGHGSSQPELTSIVRLKPSILRLGRDWVRGVDRSESKRSAIEVIGQLAGQLDAWVLAEGVTTTAELRAIAGLAVPLAQGPLVGQAREFWPAVDVNATAALPPAPTGPVKGDGVLRLLMQPAYTTRDAFAASSVLPETTGFDVVVVVDEFQRPVSLLEHGGTTAWETSEALGIHIDTPVADAVSRALVRPRASRFSPLVCTDSAGRCLGILRIERLMAHLAQR